MAIKYDEETKTCASFATDPMFIMLMAAIMLCCCCCCCCGGVAYFMMGGEETTPKGRQTFGRKKLFCI